MNKTLMAAEKQELESLELVIERGFETFMEVGNALMEIRDKRLYRLSHATFEAYCRGRWGMARRYANRLIAASNVIDNLGPMGPKPTAERHVRPLARLEPEEQHEAWQRAVETAPNGKVTGALVERVVKQLQSGREMDVHYSSEKDEWETPQALFDLLDDEFHFTLDVCALPHNAKCDDYFTPEDDGLTQNWQGVCWMNPPYGRQIEHWIGKAYASAQIGATVVCLIPARTDTVYWWDYCRFGEIRFIPRRVKFVGGESGAPFPSAVVIFGRDYPAQVIWWEDGRV